MNILVTGGLGFIGSHVSLLLLEQGHNVFVIDSLINSSKNVVNIINKLSKRKVNFYKGDIKNSEDIESIFNIAESENKSIEAVFHFAGLKSVKESAINPLAYWENNVLATHTLLKIMKKFNCKRIVFSSSATVYGENYNSPISEDVIPNPINVYGLTKLSVENLLLIPDYFFLFPNLILSNPFNLKSSAGFDAIAQSVESLISMKSNKSSVFYAKKSLKLSLSKSASILSLTVVLPASC